MNRARWRRSRIALEIVVVIALLLGLQRWQSRGVARGPAPPLSGIGLDGESLSLAALRGRPAVVHFWATWCGVCRAEESTIVALARDAPLITVASASGEREQVRRYLASRGITLPVIVDPGGQLAARFGVRSFPTTIVVGAAGEVRAVTVGYTTSIGLRVRRWLATF